MVDDLLSAAARFEEQTGLTAVEGGRHPSHGTANYIVPLGENYIELVAVVDRTEASDSLFGRWALDRGGGVGLLCLRSEQLDVVCTRLRIAASEMSRARPDGTEFSWRIAGLRAALETAGFPFFIEWATRSDQPGRTPVAHAASTQGLVGVTLSGDPEQLSSRVGGADRVSIVTGDPGIDSVKLDIDGSQVELMKLFA